MPPLRIEVVDLVYHVNSKAVDRTRLFRDDVDRLAFRTLLQKETVRSDWSVLAYSLLTTHFHVLLRLRKPTLSSGFQHLKSVYARSHNRRHARTGALWQRRFYDSIVESESHLYEAIRYVALNAPRANACGRPEEWPWASYGASIGAVPRDPIVDEAELLRLFGDHPDDARQTLKALVEERDPRLRRGQTRV